MKKLLNPIAVLFILANAFVSVQISGQTVVTSSSFVRLGDMMPNTVFNRVYNSPKTVMHMNDFKGKLLLLDFWSTTCSPCIGAMPKMVALQKKFSSRANVLLVTPDSPSVIQQFYTRRVAVKLPTASMLNEYGQLTKRLGIPTLGMYAWIDQDGVLRAVTDENQVTEQNIEAVLQGKWSVLHKPFNYGEPRTLVMSKPFLVDGNGGGASDIQFHSVFSGPVAGFGSGTFWASPNNSLFKRRIFLLNQDIGGLYRKAMARGKQYGQLWSGFPASRTIIHLDSTRLNPGLPENVYSYELIVPPGQEARLYDILIAELNQFFGLTAKIEKCIVPSLILVKHGDSVAQTSREGQEFILQADTIVFKNQLLPQVTEGLEVLLMRPVIDETGINSRVNIEWKNIRPASLNYVRQQLRRQGFDLREEGRELNILVVREQGSSSSGCY